MANNLFSILMDMKGMSPSKQQPIDKPLIPADQQLTPKAQSLSALVVDWQKAPTPEKTDELLRKMQPTINAAMTSYAPGMDNRLRVKAAKLTLAALKTYDPSFNTSPNTHVFHNLKRLSRYGAQASNIIPVSESQSLNQKYLQNIIDMYTDEHGVEPSREELADLTGISLKRIDRLINPNKVLNESATLTTDSGKDTFASSDVTDKDYFEYVYASVDNTDKKIMDWSSGIHGGKMLSNNEIANKLKITPAAVSQRRTKIQRMLSDMRGML